MKKDIKPQFWVVVFVGVPIYFLIMNGSRLGLGLETHNSILNLLGSYTIARWILALVGIALTKKDDENAHMGNS